MNEENIAKFLTKRYSSDTQKVSLSLYHCTDDGQVFGWGNSEYGQFDMITDEQQISRPTHLPLYHLCGRVQSVAATGTNCALVNGMYSYE